MTCTIDANHANRPIMKLLRIGMTGTAINSNQFKISCCRKSIEFSPIFQSTRMSYRNEYVSPYTIA